jgi:hypothetical protein
MKVPMNLIHLGVLFAFFSQVVLAYPTPVDFSGQLLKWDRSPSNPNVYYEVLTDQPESLTIFQSIVSQSASLWNSVPSSYLRFHNGSHEGSRPDVSINFDVAISGGETSAGYAVFDEYEGTVPTHCTIHIAASSAMDWTSLAKTTLHEMGHCIGLGHSLVGASIMSYQLDQNTFALALDDQAAVARLYPVDGTSPELPPGCALHNREPFRNHMVAKALVVLCCLVLPLGLTGRPLRRRLRLLKR